MPDIDLSRIISYYQFMDFINYQELKREAYLMAIKKLEEEYSHDEKILKKLDIYKNKLNNGNQQSIS